MVEKQNQKKSKEGLLLLLLGVVALAGLLYMAYSNAGNPDGDRAGQSTIETRDDR